MIECPSQSYQLNLTLCHLAYIAKQRDFRMLGFRVAHGLLLKCSVRMAMIVMMFNRACTARNSAYTFDGSN